MPAPVAKTGQTTTYATGDDGDLEKGVPWPVPRFTDNGNWTVTDNLTGLIWMKDADCSGVSDWYGALELCNSISAPDCGLTDGSEVGDWRLPNVKELHSLVDYGNYYLALPSGHPFVDVQLTAYWSSSTHADDTDYAWRVFFGYGIVRDISKGGTYNAWCVRDPFPTTW